MKISQDSFLNKSFYSLKDRCKNDAMLDVHRDAAYYKTYYVNCTVLFNLMEAPIQKGKMVEVLRYKSHIFDN